MTYLILNRPRPEGNGRDSYYLVGTKSTKLEAKHHECERNPDRVSRVGPAYIHFISTHPDFQSFSTWFSLFPFQRSALFVVNPESDLCLHKSLHKWQTRPGFSLTTPENEILLLFWAMLSLRFMIARNVLKVYFRLWICSGRQTQWWRGM